MVDRRHRARDRRLDVAASLSPVPIAFAVALVALIAFIAWGLRRQHAGRSTLLAFGLFRITSFRNGNIAAAVVSLGEFGIILALPLWLQFVVGFDALQTGLLLLSLAIGSFVASGIAGRSAARSPPSGSCAAACSPRSSAWPGRLHHLSGCHVGTPPPFLFVYGVGVGLATAQLTGVVLADVPPARAAGLGHPVDLASAGRGSRWRCWAPCCSRPPRGR